MLSFYLMTPNAIHALQEIPNPGDALSQQTRIAWAGVAPIDGDASAEEEGRSQRTRCGTCVNWFDPCSEPFSNWKICRIVTVIVIISIAVTLAIGAGYGFI